MIWKNNTILEAKNKYCDLCGFNRIFIIEDLLFLFEGKKLEWNEDNKTIEDIIKKYPALITELESRIPIGG